MQDIGIDSAAIAGVAAGTPGWSLWPLVLCLLLAAAIVTRKLWELSVKGARSLRLLERFDSLVGQRMIAEALATARESDTPGGRVLAAGLARRSGGGAHVVRSSTSMSAIESARFREWMVPLATLAALAPLTGFLASTLLAMRVLESAAPPARLAAALVPGATGLAVAILITALHAYLEARIARLFRRIAESAQRAADAVDAIDVSSGA